VQIQKRWVIYDRIVKRAFVDVAPEGVPAESLKVHLLTNTDKAMRFYRRTAVFSIPTGQSRLAIGQIEEFADFDKAITNETRIISVCYARGRAHKLLSSDITTVAE